MSFDILLESGSNLLLESSSILLLETVVASSPGGNKHAPSSETAAYWQSEAERLVLVRRLQREDEEILVMV